MCSPKSLRGHTKQRSRAEIATMPLLHFNDRQNWMKWFQTAGCNDIPPLRGPLVDQDNMVTGDDADGRGAALPGPPSPPETRSPTARPAIPNRPAGPLRLLDRLPGRHRLIPKNHHLPQLVARRSRRRHTGISGVISRSVWHCKEARLGAVPPTLTNDASFLDPRPYGSHGEPNK